MEKLYVRTPFVAVANLTMQSLTIQKITTRGDAIRFALHVLHCHFAYYFRNQMKKNSINGKKIVRNE